jgi:tetratricopeptide (TPR) repeat protein
MKSRINNPKYSAKLREYIKTSLRERSGDEGSLIELAEILLTNGYKDEAKEILEMVLRDNPEDVSALMFTAQYYIDNDNLEDLYYFFNSTIEQFPANFEIYHNFAILFTEKLEFRYALQLLSSGIEKASNNPEIRYIFGDHLEILEKYEEAIDQYKIALELNRENPEGYFKIGMIYKKMGQKYLAKEWFDKAISISIEYDEIIRSQI